MTDAKMSRQAAGSGEALAAVLADWLGLAAAPCFAVMALVTEIAEGPPEIFCLSPHEASPLSGMGLMYVLMAAFHLSPWLRLVGRRASTRRPCRGRRGR